MAEAPKTLGAARERYLERATLRSKHTVAAYRQSIASFFEFLDDTAGRGGLPIQEKGPPAADMEISALASADAPILLAFAEWLLAAPDGPDDPRPYAPSTVRLRLAGVGRWLQWLDDYGWLPPRFPLAKAQRMVRDESRPPTDAEWPATATTWHRRVTHLLRAAEATALTCESRSGRSALPALGADAAAESCHCVGAGRERGSGQSGAVAESVRPRAARPPAAVSISGAPAGSRKRTARVSAAAPSGTAGDRRLCAGSRCGVAGDGEKRRSLSAMIRGPTASACHAPRCGGW